VASTKPNRHAVADAYRTLSFHQRRDRHHRLLDPPPHNVDWTATIIVRLAATDDPIQGVVLVAAVVGAADVPGRPVSVFRWKERFG